ncbi:cupin domain-containing protein [Alkalihalobacillus pseudalcaliphilus]|uniref:cupin domain-containing protein n=1 Tax=Alkalihalobacillus pseudalcaliphilus TaxID=79884 RepID=UPI00064DEFB2|nr:cupin domain-containing protein [Alkalihalobacillus pseudalcaliphilus]KMK75205.1 cupin [Alkalihalobacillus pseudalcaliphilus]
MYNNYYYYNPYWFQKSTNYNQPHLLLNGSNRNAYVSRRTTDFGPNPYVININQATKQNNTYRTSIWTGQHLQATLMSIPVGDDIGLELHPDTEQFLRIEQGQGVVQMGDRADQLTYAQHIGEGFAIFVPAGKWHNVTNTGQIPLKLYSIYAPPHHPSGTVQQTKAIAMEQEN